MGILNTALPTLATFTLLKTPRGLKYALASVACIDRRSLTVYMIFGEGGYLAP